MAKLLKYKELQLVEQRIENPRVGGSSPPPGTIFSTENPVVALNHSFCRLLALSLTRWSKIAIRRSKSDLGVIEGWPETLLSL